MTIESTSPPRQFWPAVTTLPRDARPIPDFPGFWITRRGDVFSFWQHKRIGRNKGVEKSLIDVPHRITTGYRRGARRVFMRRDGVEFARPVEALLEQVFGY